MVTISYTSNSIELYTKNLYKIHPHLYRCRSFLALTIGMDFLHLNWFAFFSFLVCTLNTANVCLCDRFCIGFSIQRHREIEKTLSKKWNVVLLSPSSIFVCICMGIKLSVRKRQAKILFIITKTSSSQQKYNPNQTKQTPPRLISRKILYYCNNCTQISSFYIFIENCW